jgi:hypothetical protein
MKKNIYFTLLISMLLFSCAPVLIIDSEWSGSGEIKFNLLDNGGSLKFDITSWTFSEHESELKLKVTSSTAQGIDKGDKITFKGKYSIDNDGFLDAELKNSDLKSEIVTQGTLNFMNNSGKSSLVYFNTTSTISDSGSWKITK